MADTADPGAAAKVLLVEPHEVGPLVASCGLTFVTFTACFILRPIRDAIQSEQHLSTELPWVVTATLVAMFAASMLFSLLASRLPRRAVLPVTLELFALSTIAFHLVFRSLTGDAAAMAAKAFYVWFSVANLLAISTAWSVITDAFTVDQSRRLFGRISIGSTVGAMSGSAISAFLSKSTFLSEVPLGTNALLLISAALLQVAAALGWYVSGLRRTNAHVQADRGGERIGGGVLDGLRALGTQPYLLLIAGYILLYTVTSTVLSIQQSSILARVFVADDPAAARAARTAFSANITLVSNIIVLVTQLAVAAHVTRWLGVRRTLFVTPIITLGGFLLLAWRETTTTLMIATVARSSMHYAIDRPSREALYSPLDRELKYKAKNLIDTFVYRGGDALTTWAIAFLAGGPALVAATIGAAVAWLGVAAPLGRFYDRRTNSAQDRKPAE